MLKKNSLRFVTLRLLMVINPVVFLILFFNTAAICKEELPWVKASGANFIKEGKTFKFIGANAVNMSFYDGWDLDMESAIKTAKENNISVLRFYIDLGWGKDTDFDKIFDAASKYGVYVILVFTDCCCSSDFTTLNKYFQVHAPFCDITNRQSINAFKKLIKQIIERKNSVNARIYRDDPTILAWEIANELEYGLFTGSQVHKWLEEVSSYIKSLDKNHLVTIGIDAAGPEFSNGLAVYKMFDAPAVDFFSFHYYPTSENLKSGTKNPTGEDISKIKLVTNRFLSLGKPVIMGEFGFTNSIGLNNKIRSTKPEFYNLSFKEIMDAAFSAGASGVLFWGWGVPEEKRVPMWWSQESHSVADKRFCDFLKDYRIPDR